MQQVRLVLVLALALVFVFTIGAQAEYNGPLPPGGGVVGGGEIGDDGGDGGHPWGGETSSNDVLTKERESMIISGIPLFDYVFTLIFWSDTDRPEEPATVANRKYDYSFDRKYEVTSAPTRNMRRVR